jgi:hypothetical protein
MTGCSIGVKEKIRIVYVSFAKDPEIKGAIKVATNKPIAVTVVGKTDVEAMFNAGGYYLVHERDLKAFLEAMKPGR